MQTHGGTISRKVLVLALAALSMLVFSACGSSGSGNGGSADAGAGKGGLKVALLLPGRINDQGWDTIAYNGLKEVQRKLGASVAYTENVGPSNQASQFRSYASQGYDVVIGMGGQYVDGAKAVVNEFPDVKFAVIGGNGGNGSNLSSFNVRQEQTFYIAGLVAARLSKSKKLAYMSGIKVDNVVRGEVGFKQGAEAGGATVQSIWTGDFEDVNKAKEATTAVFKQGADVVQVNSNAANIGSIQAAQAAGGKAIGVYGDLTKFGPEAVATNLVPAMDKVLVKAVEQAQGSKWGDFYLFGYGDISQLAKFTSFNLKAVDAKTAGELKALIEETERKLTSGEVKVQGP